MNFLTCPTTIFDFLGKKKWTDLNFDCQIIIYGEIMSINFVYLLLYFLGIWFRNYFGDRESSSKGQSDSY
jgi:hypothetical protein